jgi:hypothetical protein
MRTVPIIDIIRSVDETRRSWAVYKRSSEIRGATLAILRDAKYRRCSLKTK